MSKLQLLDALASVYEASQFFHQLTVKTADYDFKSNEDIKTVATRLGLHIPKSLEDVSIDPSEPPKKAPSKRLVTTIGDPSKVAEARQITKCWAGCWDILGRVTVCGLVCVTCFGPNDCVIAWDVTVVD